MNSVIYNIQACYLIQLLKWIEGLVIWIILAALKISSKFCASPILPVNVMLKLPKLFKNFSGKRISSASEEKIGSIVLGR